MGHGISENLIVEMGREEFARIAGFYSSGALRSEDSDKRRMSYDASFSVGRTLDVSPIYLRLTSQAQVATRLDDAARQLHALADLIGTIKPAAELLTKTEGGAA